MAKPLAQGAASLETVTLPLLLLHLYMHCSPIQYEYMIYTLALIYALLAYLI